MKSSTFLFVLCLTFILLSGFTANTLKEAHIPVAFGFCAFVTFFACLFEYFRGR